MFIPAVLRYALSLIGLTLFHLPIEQIPLEDLPSEAAFMQSPPILLDGCDGILGDNIFTEGDFGKGSANILQNDPNIAPGYIYTRTSPPRDGYYIITNNMDEWTGHFPTWLRVQDNSPDPDGYMMVVNASYDPGIFYEQTVEGLCANTSYEFSADVINLISRPTGGHILPDISFYINDEVQFHSGPIPQDEVWHTFGFTFTTEPSDSTLKLSVRNNAPGGIGNDLALDNITFRACGPDGIITLASGSDKFICLDAFSETLVANVFNSPYPDEYFEWEVSQDGGRTYERIPNAKHPTYTTTEFTAGSYYYRFALAGTPENLDNNKCRVYSRPKEIVVVPLIYEITDTICAGGSYVVGSSTYYESGYYEEEMISSIGCDSIVQLQLTVVPDPNMRAETVVTAPSCPGESDGSFEVRLIQEGYPPYVYQLENLPVQDAPFFSGLAAGRYNFTITDRFGCSIQQGADIADPPGLEVDLAEKISLSLGQEYAFEPKLSTEQNVRFQWRPEEGLSCADCPRPMLRAINSETYSLEMTGEAGCAAVDSIFIEVRKDYKVFLPNVFSPNGDGRNDRFTLFAAGAKVEEVLRLAVYDRWGNLLFERNNFAPGDESMGWDGRSRGRLAPGGVYIYQAEVRFIDGATRIFSGDVSLLR